MSIKFGIDRLCVQLSIMCTVVNYVYSFQLHTKCCFKVRNLKLWISVTFCDYARPPKLTKSDCTVYVTNPTRKRNNRL